MHPRPRVLRIAHHGVVSAWRQRERELRARGIDVTLVSARVWNEGGARVPLRAEGDDFVRAAATLGRHPSAFLFSPFPLWRAIGEKPDLIDVHEEPSSLAVFEVRVIRWLRRSRAPYLLYSAQNLQKRFPVPFRWFERAALRGAAAAYVCNREAGEILLRKGLSGPAVHIPLGVDVELFRPAVRGAPNGPLMIGYVGRLEPHKGVDVLLRAVAGTHDWQLKITGDGPQRSPLLGLASELGISQRVEFLGHASGEELAQRYRDLDLLAVPSLPWPGWSEQFCRVAVEAMASGVPVVGSASGAIPDVVGDAGVLVEPGRPDDLRRAIEEAAEPARWQALRERAIERAQKFTWGSVADAQRALYSQVLDRETEQSALEVLIVAYGPPEQLDQCLAELGESYPVTVIDNSSLDRTREVALAHGARYVDAGGNLGFAGGVNRGLADLEGRGRNHADVLLLNPDARIDQRAVARLHEALHASPRIAAVGAMQTEPGSGRPVRVWWPFPTPWGAVVEAVGLGALRRSRGFAIGSVLLLRAQAINQVGPFDERFFLYGEETDWQLRARRLGWSVDVAAVTASHEGGGTGGDPAVREAHFYGSAERYIRKHYGAAGWQLYRAANVAGAAVRGVVLPGSRGADARRRRDLFLRGPAAVEGRLR